MLIDVTYYDVNIFPLITFDSVTHIFFFLK